MQVNTGAGCHLDADMVHRALHALEPEAGSLLFIENVGNLVCPALFDLGEHSKVVVISVTEGADKPLKYPHMFAAAGLVIINKIDLLPYVDFDLDAVRSYARSVNPDVDIIAVVRDHRRRYPGMVRAGLTSQRKRSANATCHKLSVDKTIVPE